MVGKGDIMQCKARVSSMQDRSTRRHHTHIFSRGGEDSLIELYGA